MGKSTGGITTLSEIREIASTYSLDALRYYLLRAAPFGSDLEWSEEEFDKSFNELANVVGNCLNRTRENDRPVSRRRAAGGGRAEDIDRNLVAADGEAAGAARRRRTRGWIFSRCAMLPIELARATNGYIDATAPFTLAKDPAQGGAAGHGAERFRAGDQERVWWRLLPLSAGKGGGGVGAARRGSDGESAEASGAVGAWGRRLGRDSHCFRRSIPLKQSTYAFAKNGGAKRDRREFKRILLCALCFLLRSLRRISLEF